MPSLDERTCVPCRRGTPPLTASEMEPLLDQLDGWRVEDDRRISKPYRFRDFAEAVAFVNSIANVAESQGHHPDLYVAWGRVDVLLWTHKINGLSENDFVMAAKIDRVYAQSVAP